jgi:hypothetical protein
MIHSSYFCAYAPHRQRRLQLNRRRPRKHPQLRSFAISIFRPLDPSLALSLSLALRSLVVSLILTPRARSFETLDGAISAAGHATSSAAGQGHGAETGLARTPQVVETHVEKAHFQGASLSTTPLNPTAWTSRLLARRSLVTTMPSSTRIAPDSPSSTYVQRSPLASSPSSPFYCFVTVGSLLLLVLSLLSYPHPALSLLGMQRDSADLVVLYPALLALVLVLSLLPGRPMPPNPQRPERRVA